MCFARVVVVGGSEGQHVVVTPSVDDHSIGKIE